MNRLGEETSPYLRQHRDNPVDWYPWGEEAFRRAREENRPILLSVGYSACHWCHVMAHESFEDPLLADVQNRLFVNIKVDREERPDVDRVYMDALQALTGGGGWPMTVFLLPDGRPFFAGTYFPPQDRAGLPGFRRVMEALAGAYRERYQDVVESADRLSEALRPAPLISAAPVESVLGATLAAAEERLIQSADLEFGGFGGAPKFPQAAVLDFLLTREVLNQSAAARAVVLRTLDAMADGGIRDQLGEGFHRYSVDRRWAVPHFEKMLYDNAQLVRLYLRGWLVHGTPRHLDVARHTADFLIDQMELPGGGFAASLDADTAEGEGAFYAWTTEQLSAALGPERLELALELFGGQGDAHTDQGGLVLRGGRSSAAPGGAEEADRRSIRQSMVETLERDRSRRLQPGRDDKLIVGWNALAIAALAELAVVAGESRYLESAARAAEVIVAKASVGGQLHHLFDGTRARFVATLDDLAAMALAALALHETTGAPRWFDLAVDIAKRIERDYRDAEGPGWFDVPLDHDPHLKARPRTLEDGAQPSGVSLTTELFLRLDALMGGGPWLERATDVLQAMSSAMVRFPSSFGALLCAAALLERGPIQLALVVPTGDLAHWPLLLRARSRLRPQLVVGVGQVRSGRASAEQGAPLVLDRPLLDGDPTAYVCQGFACRLPVTDGPGLERELDGADTA